MKIVVLAGGVGGAKFLLGVKEHLGIAPTGGLATESPITAIVNTADDIVLHGLQICPDLDSCMYTLSGEADTERGWGRAGETWTIKQELAAFGAEAPWFSLGDKDIASHLMRTRMLAAGYPLSDVTAALCHRFDPGVRLLPMTDDRVQTHVTIDDPDSGELAAIHFQEWWVRHRAAVPAHRITPVGADSAQPAPGVLDAIAGADLILIAPSNPVVSIGPILAITSIADAVRAASAPVVGFSPIIGGAPVRGHADKCLAAIDVEVSAAGVGGHYGARTDGGLLDAYLVDTADAETTVAGLAVAPSPLLMSSPAATAAMIARAREVVGV